MSEAFQIDKHQTKAYLMINCKMDSETGVLEKLRSLDLVKEAEITIGRHDILVLLEADSVEQLRDIITMKIRKIPEIYSTTTLMCLGISYET